MGPRTPGVGGGVLENSYVRLNVAGMSVAGSLNQLTISWPVTFKAAFGAKACRQYLFVRDDLGLTGGWWKSVGTWTVTGVSAARSLPVVEPPVPELEDELIQDEVIGEVPLPPLARRAVEPGVPAEVDGGLEIPLPQYDEGEVVNSRKSLEGVGGEEPPLPPLGGEAGTVDDSAPATAGMDADAPEAGEVPRPNP